MDYLDTHFVGQISQYCIGPISTQRVNDSSLWAQLELTAELDSALSDWHPDCK
jgi:hypothetical protein